MVGRVEGRKLFVCARRKPTNIKAAYVVTRKEREKERERVSERSKRSEITARSGEWGFSPVAEVEPPAAGLGKGQGVRRGSGQLTELKPPAVVVVAAVASSA